MLEDPRNLAGNEGMPRGRRFVKPQHFWPNDDPSGNRGPWQLPGRAAERGGARFSPRTWNLYRVSTASWGYRSTTGQAGLRVAPETGTTDRSWCVWMSRCGLE